MADGVTAGPALPMPSLPGGVFVAPSARRTTPTGASGRWLARHRRTRVLRRRVRTAFVFAGGGSRGSAQIGMLQALVARDITADAVYGASVGAINAAGYCSQPNAAGIDRMAERWRSITRDDVFPQGRVPTPLRFVQQREAVHANDGVRRIIEEGIGFERLEQSAVPLEVVATCLHDGRTQWFTEGPAVERILASAALPALLPPVEIDGEAFIDGGVVDNVPVGRAISEGAERIFVLLCGPMHFAPHRYRRPVEAVLTAFFIAVHAKFARELERVPEGVEVIVFTVDTEPVSRYNDFSATDTLIAAGRANANAVLDFWEGGGVGDRVGIRPQPPLRAAVPGPAPTMAPAPPSEDQAV
ncbi:MAG TPA: patatin-like phospholipase family protein [Acidimicrobiales bacterium]|nr:patatin-like phospholipase family protein [Acidimicrobiales bacterium]